MASHKRRNSITEQFAWQTISMLESVAHRTLSLGAHRILERIEVELGHHGGHDNGRLPVTYADFVRFGIDAHAVGPGIREAAALGFIEITQPGRAGNETFRRPNLFRLCYRHCDGRTPTDEWKRFEPRQGEKVEDAIERVKAVAAEARRDKAKNWRPVRFKNKSPMGENAANQWGKTHQKSDSLMRETPCVAAESPITIYISGRRRRAGTARIRSARGRRQARWRGRPSPTIPRPSSEGEVATSPSSHACSASARFAWRPRTLSMTASSSTSEAAERNKGSS